MSGPGCRPWCVDHDGAVCRSETRDGVTLTWMPGERETAWIDGYDVDEGMPLADAERAAGALLGLLHRRFAVGERVRLLVGQRVTYADPDVESEDGDGEVSFRVPSGTEARIVGVRSYPTPLPYVVITDDDQEFGVREEDIARVPARPR